MYRMLISHLVLVGVAVVSEPQPQELLVNVLWLLTCPVPGFVCVRQPVPVHSSCLQLLLPIATMYSAVC